MSLSARFAKRSLLILLTLVQLAFVECCSTFRFKAEEGVALFGHVIKNITTDRPIKCQLECANLPKCMSINTRQNEAGTTTCEMSGEPTGSETEARLPVSANDCKLQRGGKLLILPFQNVTKSKHERKTQIPYYLFVVLRKK